EGRPPTRSEAPQGGRGGVSSSSESSPHPARFARDPPPGEGWRARRGGAHHVDVEFADGTTASTRLLVAADGAQSQIRARAGIASHGWTYNQSAIVTTVTHERDHRGRAEEHFLPAGPFAILPLKGARSSIVWTESTREAERIVVLPDAEFHA